MESWEGTMANELGISTSEINNMSMSYSGKEYLDMTTSKWKNMSVSNQQKYAKAYQKAYSKYVGKDIEKSEYKHGVYFEFMLVPPGKFLMGSPEGEKARTSAERQRCVLLTKEFYMGKYEVTQAQWRAVTGDNPSNFKNSGDNAPVEKVSWNNIKDKFLPKMGSNFRLPTEAEWEYACRSGVTARFYWGDDNYSEIENYAWYTNNSGSKTHSVGQKLPNAWNLYDMSGNVWEIVEDNFDFPSNKNIDPLNMGQHFSFSFVQPERVGVIKGAGWNACRGNYIHLRVAERYRHEGEEQGFRLSLTI